MDDSVENRRLVAGRIRKESLEIVDKWFDNPNCPRGLRIVFGADYEKNYVKIEWTDDDMEQYYLSRYDNVNGKWVPKKEKSIGYITG